MWDVHCNTTHRVHITSTSLDGKFPNIMTIRWNDVVLAPTPSLYIGCEWSTNVVWRANSVLEPTVTYRIFHFQQRVPSSALNVPFMTEMLHSSGKWYGNVCAVAVLADKTVRSMDEGDLVQLRCAFARYVRLECVNVANKSQSFNEAFLCARSLNGNRHVATTIARRP